MRAMAVIENGKPLQPIELPTPEPEGEQVLLEVTHCGVCHSDIHIWDGFYDMGGGKVLTLKDRGVTLPLAMGHEAVGRVAKLGPKAAASGLKVGDLRLVFPWVGCGTCAKCRADEDNMCLKPRSLGVYQHGGYATHILVPEPRHLIAIDGLDPALAATYACSGLTVYSAIQKVLPLPPDEPVVLFGAGGLGLNAIAVLKALGHRRIVVVDIDVKKREAATAEGASDVVDGKADTPECAIPWSAAKMVSVHRVMLGAVVPCKAAICAASASIRPSEPGGFVRVSMVWRIRSCSAAISMGAPCPAAVLGRTAGGCNRPRGRQVARSEATTFSRRSLGG
mgnify:CR=1 FL=1